VDEVFIKEVTVENFQSHHHTHIKLNQGINILSGSSNHGKSAILRAIKWVITNDPSGTDFITLGKDQCRVSLKFSNGYEVIRTKSRSGNVNTYDILKENERVTGSPLTGFGTSVPEIVRSAMEINRPDMIFSSQLEAPFLISETPKVRAEKIGNHE
jgi:exonuclease SbcC